jgi:hypothetical protein
MSLEAAVDTTRLLKNALTREIERARNERLLLRSLDGSALMESARLREAFNAHALYLSRELTAQLSRAATALGASLAQLVFARRPDAVKVSNEMSEVRALAATLSRLDALNLKLAERGLTCVRAYQAKLNPRGSAYDRFGARSVHEASTSSQRA